MNSHEIRSQKVFWNAACESFDAIYTGEKPKLRIALDKLFRKDMYERFEYTIHHSEPIRNRTFLDVGCGTGRYSIALAKRGARQVTGLDIAENMVQASRDNANAHGIEKKCEFFLSDILRYHPDNKFDVTIGIGLFDYVREPIPVLRKMRQLTRDKVVLSFPRRNTWRAPIRKLRLGLLDCPVYFYTRLQLQSLMKTADFNYLRIDKVGKLFCVVARCD
jgi:ubiquinone/menaquinone biosynthesis C-methylase UbiE